MKEKILKLLDENDIDEDLQDCDNLNVWYNYETFWVTSIWNYVGNDFLEDIKD